MLNKYKELEYNYIYRNNDLLHLLEDLTIDLKCIECSDSYDEMLSNLGKDNELYKELYEVREKDKERNKEYYNEDLLFFECRSCYAKRLEETIMTLLKTQW